MHQYDAALKLLLQASTGSVLKQATGLTVSRWLNVEMQQVQVARADLLGTTSDGGILHVELQSTNDPDMELRMAEYCLAIYRQFRKYPKQVVLYVGEAKLNMKAVLRGPSADPDLAYRYTLLDFREMDGAILLTSSHVEDNLLAILARLRDQTAAVRQILERIVSLDDGQRRVAFAQFLILSGLRRLGQTIRKEAQKMPIMNDILDHDLLGPAILQGRQEGRLEGREEGRQEGRSEVVCEILSQRFGPLPEWIQNRLLQMSNKELAEVSRRSQQVASISELFL